ncbi:MAG: hypothetical protein ABF479_11595, partial [Gluconacetobacter sp.]
HSPPAVPTSAPSVTDAPIAEEGIGASSFHASVITPDETARRKNATGHGIPTELIPLQKITAFRKPDTPSHVMTA